jgi:putative transposase
VRGFFSEPSTPQGAVQHVHLARFRTRAEARAAVFEYVEVFYNRQRLHSGLGYRTPAEARADMEGITMPAAA